MKYSKIYTKGGDKGQTSLWSGERVPKTNIRIETVGVFDELNAALGVAYSNSSESLIQKKIRRHTADALTFLMGEIASTKNESIFDEKWLVELQDYYDTLSKTLDEEDCINGWVTYGMGGISSSYYDWATTVARRAELHLWKLKDHFMEIPNICYQYMNLLSKVLFLMGRKDF